MRSTVEGSSAVAVAGRRVSVMSASSPTSAPRPTTSASPSPTWPADRLKDPSWITKPASASSPAANNTSPLCT